MKGSRTASGPHILCVAMALLLLLNGTLLYFPLSILHQSPTPLLPTFGSQSPMPLGHHSPMAGSSQPFDNQSVLMAHLRWAQQTTWQHWDSQRDLTLTLDHGLLQRETLHFTRLAAKPRQIAVEDYDPSACPFEDYIWTDEESYMSFRINGTEPVRIDGFWIYLRGESQGIFRYRLYGAQPGTLADTFVNTSAPLTSWIEVPISPTLEPGEEYWFWIDSNESAVILDPLSTYARTFYFGLGRAFGATTDTRINWVYCRDDVNPDEEDEGDCYGRFGSWSYRTRDLFLNVSILPEKLDLYPSDIAMAVNSESVSNLSSPSKGWWDSEDYLPPLSINGNLRAYQVTVNWPDFYQWSIEFDVQWSGYFFDSVLVSSTPIAASLEANWLLTMIIDFPTGIDNQTISFTMPQHWVVKYLHRNTILYTDWIIEENLLLIHHAEDGLWQLYCSVPISPLTFYWWLLVWIAVGLIVALLALIIFYRQQILLPRQRRRRRDLQALADSFYDIYKIRRILLIHKETGLCLLDPIMDRKMKANLVSALIQAITAFGVNLTETDETPDLIDDTDSLQQITYRDFHIIVHDGQYMRNALIFKQPPSSELDKRLEEFTTRFEDRYHDVLENWVGRLNIFGDAITLVDEYLFISLRLPHIIHAEHVTRHKLPTLERVLYTLATTVANDEGSFFIRDVVDKFLREKGVQRIEVFEALFNLRDKGVFVPIHTGIPYEFSNNTPS